MVPQSSRHREIPNLLRNSSVHNWDILHPDGKAFIPEHEEFARRVGKASARSEESGENGARVCFHFCRVFYPAARVLSLVLLQPKL